MNNIQHLEIIKLINELKFVESDYLYKSEVIKKGDIVFLNEVNEIVENHSELKKILEKREQNVEPILPTPELNINIDNNIRSENIEIKKFYREIAKLTHPDIIKNLKLNELYIEATNAYNIEDLATIYKICVDLMINFEWGENEINLIKDKIDKYKSQINFLESTYTFLWVGAKEEDKKSIILQYIKSKLI
jgi:vacuolar-type H+-ATPase subunit D/Vma8